MFFGAHFLSMMSMSPRMYHIPDKKQPNKALTSKPILALVINTHADSNDGLTKLPSKYPCKKKKRKNKQRETVARAKKDGFTLASEDNHLCFQQ